MQKITFLLLLTMAGITLKAQKLQAWFSFEDMTNKVLYVTPPSYVDRGPDDAVWQRSNYEAGFLETNPSVASRIKQIRYYSSDLEFLDVEDSGFKAMQLKGLQKRIDILKQNGYQIITIAMPKPIKLKPRDNTNGHASQQ